VLVVLRQGPAAARYVPGGPTANRHNAVTPGAAARQHPKSICAKHPMRLPRIIKG
jgi:hypothetical protein